MTKENLDPTDEESQKLHSLQVEGKRETSSNMPAFMTKEYWRNIGIRAGCAWLCFVLAVIVLVIVLIIALLVPGGGGENTKPPVDPTTLTPKPPNDDELEVTDKITFTVATREDGDKVGSFDIGIFGGMFPVTKTNFIALAKGTVENRALPYKYKESTFPDDGSEDYFMRGGENVEPGSTEGNCIYSAGKENNRYWKKDQENAEFPELEWENVTGADLIKCCRLKGWVAMEDITRDENNPAYNSIFKIFTDNVTWDDEDSERDLVFGKVLDNGMDSLEVIKNKCMKKHDCVIQNAEYSPHSETITKPKKIDSD